VLSDVRFSKSSSWTHYHSSFRNAFDAVTWLLKTGIGTMYIGDGQGSGTGKHEAQVGGHV
jgi:hypothetical protein